MRSILPPDEQGKGKSEIGVAEVGISQLCSDHQQRKL